MAGTQKISQISVFERFWKSFNDAVKQWWQIGSWNCLDVKTQPMVLPETVDTLRSLYIIKGLGGVKQCKKKEYIQL